MAVYFILIFVFCFVLIFEVLNLKCFKKVLVKCFEAAARRRNPVPGLAEGHPAGQRGQGRVLHLPITPRYDLSANNSFYRLGLSNSYSCGTFT